jgi:hypothetical protein
MRRCGTTYSRHLLCRQVTWFSSSLSSAICLKARARSANHTDSIPWEITAILLDVSPTPR